MGDKLMKAANNDAPTKPSQGIQKRCTQGCMSYTAKQSMRNILHNINFIAAANGATRRAIIKISRVAVTIMAGEMMFHHRSP